MSASLSSILLANGWLTMKLLGIAKTGAEWVLWLLVILGVIATFIAVERILFYKKHKADAERLIACAAARPKQVFAGMFQMRVEPRYLKLRQLIQGGELGELVRMNWIITDWFRTEAYYASGGWRATWKGEGGGVLLNQCLHQLQHKHFHYKHIRYILTFFY